ncbi:MAG TPA: class III extradiol ring-cleavage dioxygenase [Steroidobacteraceae bacterium]|nr:class III extradiol ring-cleavage dioxygenase [Steroidobacteraceae bacterium]
MTTAPALFVSHGAPTFALDPGLLGPKLTRIGEGLQDLAAVAVVSAHWQTRGVQVMQTAAPETVHDFRGFPPELYRLRYPAPGAPGMARDTAALLEAAGLKPTLENGRGIDHGVWVPLLYLLPKAQVPVFQVSLPFDLDAAGALALGKALAPLRARGVLLMGSGSLTHNLSEIGLIDPNATQYAVEFTAWIRARVQRRDLQALADYRHRAPHALRAHPTEEHFLPLLVALGASDSTDEVTVIEGGMTYGVLSMESYAFRRSSADG